MKITGIYLIINKINGKKYVGQSIDIHKRWKDHLNATNNIGIHGALKKYGKENFDFIILLECPEDMLNQWEIDMIALYNTYSGWDNSWGYNLTLGGANVWNKGKHLSEETKQKMSIAHIGKTSWNKGKHLSEEHKEKLSINSASRRPEVRNKIAIKLKGNTINLGRKRTEEYRLKQSESHKGKSPGNKGKKLIWNDTHTKFHYE